MAFPVFPSWMSGVRTPLASAARQLARSGFVIGVVATLALVLVLVSAQAEHANEPPEVTARLIAGVSGVGTEATVPLGLEVRLAPGWHTYWRNPGSAGQPPHVAWVNIPSSNLAKATLSYPAPSRFAVLGLEGIGYEQTVVFPLEARLVHPGKPLHLRANLDILVCKTLCLPKTFVLALEVPHGPATPSPDSALLKAARAKVPSPSGESDLVLGAASRQGSSVYVTAKSLHAPFTDPTLFLEGPSDVEFNSPKVTLSDDRHEASFVVPIQVSLGTTTEDVPLGASLTATLVDGDRAIERALDVLPVPDVAPTPKPMDPLTHPLPPLLMIVLLAFLGGFILNLMPCVLPVLSLKLLALMNPHHATTRQEDVRRSFLLTAAGIEASFLALAGLMLAFKAAGHTVGWGVQFQEPLFLVFLALVLTFFAANLAGLWIAHLPRTLADALQTDQHTPTPLGNFATGAFATLLATPCSAPFLGTAVSFALVADSGTTLLIFAALGIGMALPYLAVAAWPRLAQILPRPGAWMQTLRRVLALVLAGTAAWLLHVLSLQVAPAIVVGVAVCLGGILGTLAFLRNRKRRLMARLAVAAMSLVALVLVTFDPGVGDLDAQTGKPAWAALDERVIEREVAAGRTVFVDVTAAWCLTCKANKLFVLDRSDVAKRLARDPNILTLRADWTLPNLAVTAFLNKYGRYGVPFDAVFGPGEPDGLVLPEILTPGLVLRALDRAGKKTE